MRGRRNAYPLVKEGVDMLVTPTETPIPTGFESPIDRAVSTQKPEKWTGTPSERLKKLGTSFELQDEFGRSVGIIRYPRHFPRVGFGENTLYLRRSEGSRSRP